MPAEDANVFLSWSGSLSRAIAVALREWLPNVVRDAVPWLSSEDIAKGAVWNTEIAQQLNRCKVGIIVLTQQNLNAPWVLFEAGALFRSMPNSNVCTLLCDFKPPVTGPLGQFQATELTETDILRLCKTLASVNASSAAGDRTETWFKKFWPDLAETCEKAKKEHGTSGKSSPPPSTDLVLRDILAGVQALQRQQGEFDTKLTNLGATGMAGAIGKSLKADIRYSKSAADTLAQMARERVNRICSWLEKIFAAYPPPATISSPVKNLALRVEVQFRIFDGVILVEEIESLVKQTSPPEQPSKDLLDDFPIG